MEHTARRPRPWLLVVPTVADVDERDASLQKLMEIHHEVVDGFKKSDHYTAYYSWSRWPETPGGAWHIFRQSQNFARLGKKIYVDLCFNQPSISDIYIIATESGAYLIMQVLRFLKEYGNSLQHDFEKLHQRWMEFIFFAQPNPEPAPLKNELLRLVRSVNLIHPSLPPPSGLARLTWRFTEPGLYRYRNVSSRDNITPFDCLVIWLKEIDEVRRYRVSISDNATVEWIEGDDTKSVKRLVHNHIHKVLTHERSHILPPEVGQAEVESKNHISRT